MTLESLYALFIIQISRTRRKGMASGPLPMLFALAGLLPLMQSGNYWYYLLIIAVGIALDRMAAKPGKSPEARRLLSTIIIIGMIFAIIDNSSFDRRVSGLVHDAVEAILGSNLLLGKIGEGSAKTILLVFNGIIIVGFEANFAVMAILKYSVAFPAENNGTSNSKEMGMGRIIGALERILVYCLIITGNTSTIGFVIAAKALARFKELEKREFAEYFLVGTLSSMILTVAIGLFVKSNIY